MKNKISAWIVCVLTICMLVIQSTSVCAESRTNTASEVQSLIDGIVVYKCELEKENVNVNEIQGWINGSLTQSAGVGSEWYVLALSQSLSQSGKTYDFSEYQTALKKYLTNHKVPSATSKQKYALCLAATGSTDSYISEVMESTIGKNGIMSWIYGLHLLNNGYVSTTATKESVKQKLMDLQLADGGWALMGKYSDVDVTAMTIQALAPYYKKDASVTKAIDKALNVLSGRQLEGGDFQSYGKANPESTAQVLVALSSLGIDGLADSRFIKNGNTLLDGLKKFASVGGFCHEEGGAVNESATVQTFYSLISYLRMLEGKSGLYILDHCNPAGLPAVKPSGSAQGTGSGQVSASGQASGSGQVSAGGQISDDGQTSDGGQTSGEATPDTGQISDTEQTPESKPITDSEQSVKNEQKTEEEKVSYKVWVSLAIAGVAGIGCLILFFLKKRNKKNFIAIGIGAVILILFVGVTDFQSKNQYYDKTVTVKKEVVGTVSLTIRCDTVVGKKDSEYIPEDGVILETTEFEIEEQDTVYDILTEAAKQYEIQVENTGTNGMVYIAGIHYLYEFDFGDLSGWMYRVNGKTPSVGCHEYVLSNGDCIEWLYTCELGKDLE